MVDVPTKTGVVGDAHALAMSNGLGNMERKRTTAVLEPEVDVGRGHEHVGA